MSQHVPIKRYLAIIRRLQRGPADFQELHFHLQNESEISGNDLNISQRTLQRYIKEIGDLFHMEIRYDKTKNAYAITDTEEPDQHSIRLLESYEMLDALHMAGHYTPYVFF